MEESKIIGGISTETELKAQFTEDPDEAWLDDLLCNLIAMEDRNRETVSKGIMVDIMRQLPDLEFQWSNMAPGCWHPLHSVPQCYLGSDIIILPPQEQEQEMEAELEKFLKNASTQTCDNTSCDAGTQVHMDTCLKGSPCLADCQ